MSRVGKKEIDIQNSQITISEKRENKTFDIVIKGPLGENKVELPHFVIITRNENKLSITVTNPEDNHQKAMWGTVNRLIQGAIIGVIKGFFRMLFTSQGYAFDYVDGKINFKIGLSHPLSVPVIPGMKVEKKNSTQLQIAYHNKQILNQFVAELCKLRPVNPYTQKGIWADGQFILKKEVKKK